MTGLWNRSRKPEKASMQVKSRLNTIMIVAALFALIVPLSLSFWILSLFSLNAKTEHPSPLRWLISFSLPIFIAHWALRKKSLDWSGALAGLIVGFVLSLSSYCFIAMMITFFVTSSKATKFKQSVKRRFDSEFREGGQRNWIQVVCNSGVACELALLYLVERGMSGEIPINFVHEHNASWLALAVLGAISCANGDTWASELGTVLSKGDPWLITSWKTVPRGTNGGVSIVGLIVSALGGLVIGLAYYVTLLLCVNRDVLSVSPPQWPLIMVGLFGGLYGSIVDSLLGAIFQYSGRDVISGKIVEVPGETVEHISGAPLLDNHSVNLISSLITALTVPYFSYLF